MCKYIIKISDLHIKSINKKSNIVGPLNLIKYSLHDCFLNRLQKFFSNSQILHIISHTNLCKTFFEELLN